MLIRLSRQACEEHARDTDRTGTTYVVRAAGEKAGRSESLGVKKVIGPYIVDFASRDPMLVIEVDGDSHSSQIDYDTERTAYLQTQGYRVIRFSSYRDIMGNIEGVLSVVQTMIATPPLPSLSPEGERV